MKTKFWLMKYQYSKNTWFKVDEFETREAALDHLPHLPSGYYKVEEVIDYSRPDESDRL